jgi:hypothetical protein
MNALYIDRVKVRYRKNGRSAFGFLLFDDFESDNVLCFDAEGDVPRTLRGLVELCREEYCVNAIDLLERCVADGHPPTSTASRWTLRNWPPSWPRPATTENLRMLCQNPASTFADDAAFRRAAWSW